MRGTQDTARLAAVAAVVLGALVLVVLAASSDRAATLTPRPESTGTRVADPAALLPPTRQPDELRRTQDSQVREMPTWLVWTITIVSVAPLVLGLLFARSLVWTPRFNPGWRLRRRRVDGEPPPVDDEARVAQLATAVDEGLRELDQGGPGEGVVASWVLLERAAADAGTHRAAPDTPSELAGRLIDRHAVSSGPLLRLADLYREARFSRHELPEQARVEAREVLVRLRAELSASPIGGRR